MSLTLQAHLYLIVYVLAVTADSSGQQRRHWENVVFLPQSSWTRLSIETTRNVLTTFRQFRLKRDVER